MPPKDPSLAHFKPTLIAYSKQYHAARGDKRDRVVQELIEEINNDPDHQYEGKLEELKTKIKNWYNNNRNSIPDESPLVQVGTSWNYRLVVQHIHKEEIAQKMKETGLKASDKGWIQKFQQMVSEVIQEMGGEEAARDKYGEMAKEWNEGGAPEELRRKTAVKKAGPAVEAFLKKMQQQMGVAITGFAAYRNEEGKLCTFDFSTQDDRKESFSQVNSTEVNQFLRLWGNWAAEKGVGNLEPNEGGDEQDEGESNVTKDEAWKILLKDQKPLALKSWAEVTSLKANRANMGLALREFMRVAWENSGRRGKITWGNLTKNPQSLLPSRFVLDTKLENPTRMSLATISVYWNYWFLRDQKGDPFLFLSPDEDYQDMAEDDGEDQGIAGGDEDNQEIAGGDEEMQDMDPVFKIDNGVLPPFMCGYAPSERTECLQGLVTSRSKMSKCFRAITNLVNKLEDKDTPSRYKNARWEFLDWSWDSVHLPEEIHRDRKLMEGFLHWFDREVSELTRQSRLNKNQLQQLLLGAGLLIRDLEFSCFTDVDETPMPPFVLHGCMEEKDAEAVERTLDAMLEIVCNHLDDKPSTSTQKGRKTPRSPKKAATKRKRTPTPVATDDDDDDDESPEPEPRRSARQKQPAVKKKQTEEVTKTQQKSKKTRK